MESIVSSDLYNGLGNVSARFYNSESVASNTNVVGTTRYKNIESDAVAANRAPLALESIRKGVELGVRMYVVDANSDKEWVEEAKDVGGEQLIIIPENLEGIAGEDFMGRSRRQVMQYALEQGGDNGTYVWTEFEKHPFLIDSRGRSPLLDVASIVNQDNADCVIPRRIDELKSYPAQQRAEEVAGNLTVMDHLREHFGPEVPYLDFWIGPRAMNSEVAEKLVSYDGTLNGNAHDQWESIFAPIWKAMSDGDRVVGSPVNFVYPAEQKEFEEGNATFSSKRNEQLYVLTKAIEDFRVEDNLRKQAQRV